MEAERLEVIEKGIAEKILRAEVINIFVGETHVLHVFDDLLEPRKDRKASAVGVAPIENVECHPLIDIAPFEVAVRHGHLVEVHDHADVPFVELRHAESPCL